MEYSGCVPRDCYDEVVFRGDVAAAKFIAFWMKGGTVLAGFSELGFHEGEEATPSDCR